MNPKAIVGYGALAKQLLLLDGGLSNGSHIIFDDNALAQGLPHSYAFNAYLEHQFHHCEFFVAMGYAHPHIKQQVILKLKAFECIMPNIISPSAHISSGATLASNVYVYPMCNVDKNVKLDDGVLLNNSVVISHDSVVGMCTFVAPGAVVCGSVTIGERCFIGAGSIITDGITIGNDVQIGAGSVITNDVEDNATVIGNPMRVLNHKLKI